MADPGFSWEGEAPTPKLGVDLLTNFFAENCTKMKEFGHVTLNFQLSVLHDPFCCLVFFFYENFCRSNRLAISCFNFIFLHLSGLVAKARLDFLSLFLASVSVCY